MPAAEPEPGAGVFLQSAAADGLCLCPGGAAAPQRAAPPCASRPTPPAPPAALRPEEKVLPQVLRHDVLLFYPFQSMDPFLHLVREAASDPCVLSIKITIYRLAAKAKLAEYLCAAAENGKEVTVLMELRARFDEQNNIQWAERMEEAGCTILYGAEGHQGPLQDLPDHPAGAGAAPAHHPGGDGQLQRKDRPAVHRPVPDDRPAGAGGGRRRPVSEPGHSQPGWNIRAAAGLPLSAAGPLHPAHRPGDRQGGPGVSLPEAELHHRPEAHRQAGPGLPGRSGGGDERAGDLLPAPRDPRPDRPHHRVLHCGPLSGAHPDLPLRPWGGRRPIPLPPPTYDPEHRAAGRGGLPHPGPGASAQGVPHHRRADLGQRQGPPAGPGRAVAPLAERSPALLQPGGVPAGGGGGRPNRSPSIPRTPAGRESPWRRLMERLGRA